MQYNIIRDFYTDIPLNVFGLSTRAIKTLEKAGTKTLEQLIDLDDDSIRRIKGIGNVVFGEIFTFKRRALTYPAELSDKPVEKTDLLNLVQDYIIDWKHLSFHEIQQLNVDHILPVYKENQDRLFRLSKIVKTFTPPLGTNYPILNILISIATVKACKTVPQLLSYLFRDFSIIERKVLLKNYDGNQRCLAKVGHKHRLKSREGIRQIYLKALRKWCTPYQMQKQSGLYFKVAVMLDPDKRFQFDDLALTFKYRKTNLREAILLINANKPFPDSEMFKQFMAPFSWSYYMDGIKD